jgi:hypothetical protein
MQPPIRYEPALFGLSIAITIAASAWAFQSAFAAHGPMLSAFRKKAGSAIFMGGTIYGMHCPGGRRDCRPQQHLHGEPRTSTSPTRGTLGGFCVVPLWQLCSFRRSTPTADFSAKYADSLRQLTLVLKDNPSAFWHASLNQEVQVRMRLNRPTASARRTRAWQNARFNSSEASAARTNRRRKRRKRACIRRARTESVLNSMAKPTFWSTGSGVTFTSTKRRFVAQPSRERIWDILWDLHPYISAPIGRQCRRAMDERVSVPFSFFTRPSTPFGKPFLPTRVWPSSLPTSPRKGAGTNQEE